MRLQDTDKLQFAASDGYSLRNSIKDGYSAIDGYTVSASFTSAPFFIGRVLLYMVVVSTTSGSGTVKVQGCIDDCLIGEPKPDPGLQNWFDLDLINPKDNSTNVSQTISGASICPFLETSAGYRWIRLVYTNTSGSCNITAKVQIKGVG